MSIFSKLFAKEDHNSGKPGDHMDQASNTTADPSELTASVMMSAKNNLKDLATEKDARPAVTQEELLQYFAEYFSPNTEFFSVPGGTKSNAYFHAVNAARDEMIQHPDLFEMATKWKPAQLVEMINNPIPVITNMLICGLIFRTGDYGVLKSSVICVDFCEKIPNCISLYLLLTARKLPEEQRRQIIDAGDGTDKAAFKAAMKSLEILDPNWTYTIV